MTILKETEQHFLRIKNLLSKSISNIDINECKFPLGEQTLDALSSSAWLVSEWVDIHSRENAFSLGRLLKEKPGFAKIIHPSVHDDRTLSDKEINEFLANEHDYDTAHCLISESETLNQCNNALSSLSELMRDSSNKLISLIEIKKAITPIVYNGKSLANDLSGIETLNSHITEMIPNLKKSMQKLKINHKRDYALHQKQLKSLIAYIINIEKKIKSLLSNTEQYEKAALHILNRIKTPIRQLQEEIKKTIKIDDAWLPDVNNKIALSTWIANCSGCDEWDFTQIRRHLKKLSLLRMLETDGNGQLKNFLPGDIMHKPEDVFHLLYNQISHEQDPEALYINQCDLAILSKLNPDIWNQSQVGCHITHILAMIGARHNDNTTCQLLSNILLDNRHQDVNASSKNTAKSLVLSRVKSHSQFYPRTWSLLNFVILGFTLYHKSARNPLNVQDRLEAQYPGLRSLLILMKTCLSDHEFIQLIGSVDYASMLINNTRGLSRSKSFTVIRQMCDYANGQLCCNNNALLLLDAKTIASKKYTAIIPASSFYHELPLLLFCDQFENSKLESELKAAYSKTRAMVKPSVPPLITTSQSSSSFSHGDKEDGSPTSVASVSLVASSNEASSSRFFSQQPKRSQLPPKKRKAISDSLDMKTTKKNKSLLI